LQKRRYRTKTPSDGANRGGSRRWEGADELQASYAWAARLAATTSTDAYRDDEAWLLPFAMPRHRRYGTPVRLIREPSAQIVRYL
jgi:hypothetical protein